MSNNQKVYIILALIIIMGIGFLTGIFVGLSRKNNDIQANSLSNNTISQTFYATIEKINQYDGNTVVLVKGLEVNDINYRGEFNLSIKDTTIITWRGENINISELDIGDNISITFNDETINSISPAPIRSVQRIQLLDDEK